MKAAFATISAALALAAPVSTANAEPQRVLLSIRATVPVICRLTLQGAPAWDAGDYLIGDAAQLCNSAQGYRLIMRHPAGMDGVSVSVGGTTTFLSGGSETILAEADAPVFRTSAVTVRNLASPAQAEGLTLAIEPKTHSF